MKHSLLCGALIGFAVTGALSLLGGREADGAALDALLGAFLFALVFRGVSGRDPRVTRRLPRPIGW